MHLVQQIVHLTRTAIFGRYRPDLEQQINHRFERALNILDTLSVQSEGTARLREYAGSLIGRNK
jgi:hypothetical protein